LPSSNSGISPNRSPASIKATRDSRPSIDRRPTATRPLRTTNSSSASSSSSKTTKLRSHSSGRAAPTSVRKVLSSNAENSSLRASKLDVVHVVERH
jgi:hypothetical protein